MYIRTFDQPSRGVLGPMHSQHLPAFTAIISKPKAGTASLSTHDALIAESLEYLASNAALESIEIDAYWPKWSGPWWQMMLLHEMGLTSSIPEPAITAVVEALDTRFLKFFPFHESEVPEGRDPLNSVACHCQLGTVHQLLFTYGVDVDKKLPWLRPWYLRYQMQDGGLNCDEAAYTRPVCKSSVVSTLPPLEAVLICTPREFTTEERSFLSRGADYLIEKKLFRAASSGKPIDADWLKLCFPRFYHYDVLRGLSFLLKCSLMLGKALPIDAISECLVHIDDEFSHGKIHVQRAAWAGAMSRWFDASSGSWERKPAQSNSLLDAVSATGVESPYLTKIWNETKADLSAVIQEGLLQPECAAMQGI
jgi:hypothetical protein